MSSVLLAPARMTWHYVDVIRKIRLLWSLEKEIKAIELCFPIGITLCPATLAITP